MKKTTGMLGVSDWLARYRALVKENTRLARLVKKLEADLAKMRGQAAENEQLRWADQHRGTY